MKPIFFLFALLLTLVDQKTYGMVAPDSLRVQGVVHSFDQTHVLLKQGSQLVSTDRKWYRPWQVKKGSLITLFVSAEDLKTVEVQKEKK